MIKRSGSASEIAEMLAFYQEAAEYADDADTECPELEAAMRDALGRPIEQWSELTELRAQD